MSIIHLKPEIADKSKSVVEHTLGDSDPALVGRSQTYGSGLNGLDTKVYLDDVQVVSCQGVSFIEYDKFVTGSFILLKLKNSFDFVPGQTFGELDIRVATDDGYKSSLGKFKNLRVMTRSLGVSIDDIIVEEYITWVADRF